MMNRLLHDKEGPEQHEASDADSQAGALSDSSVESDLEDVFHVRALPTEHRTWMTDEDREFARVRALAAHVREQPHLPLKRGEVHPRVSQSDLDAYVKLPYAHCPMKGCTWTRADPCKYGRPPEYYLLQHIQQRHLGHKSVVEKCCGKKCVETTGKDPAGEYLDYLEQAVVYKAEHSDMPMVGGALDRRTLRTANMSLGDDDVHAYM